MASVVSDPDAFTGLVVADLTRKLARGELPAEKWQIDGPHMAQIHSQGTATSYITQVGESEVYLRRCNISWLYTIFVARHDVIIVHDVSDDASSALGQLVDSVVALCEPVVLRERSAALTEFGVA